VPAPLGFGVWTTQFAGSDSGTTDVVVVTTRGAAAAQLAGLADVAGAAAVDRSGVVVLHANPGAYVLTANAMLADTLGRQSQRLAVLPLGAEPGVSGLLVATAWGDTVVSRRMMLDRVQRDLTFPSGTTIRAYAEIYGLPVSPEGAVRYTASYQFYPTADPARDARRDSLPGGIRLTFDRARVPAGGRVAEWLDITPAQVPPGRYLLRLEIAEPGGARVIGGSQIGFEIREP
jgi:hypothetical protein